MNKITAAIVATFDAFIDLFAPPTADEVVGAIRKNIERLKNVADHNDKLAAAHLDTSQLYAYLAEDALDERDYADSLVSSLEDRIH